MRTVDYFFHNSGYFYNKSLPKLTGLQWEDEILYNYKDGKIAIYPPEIDWIN